MAGWVKLGRCTQVTGLAIVTGAEQPAALQAWTQRLWVALGVPVTTLEVLVRPSWQ